jgi:hypothetical protein
MSNSEENHPNEQKEDVSNTTSEENISKSTSEDELLKAQLEAEKAVSKAVQDINKTINS